MKLLNTLFEQMRLGIQENSSSKDRVVIAEKAKNI